MSKSKLTPEFKIKISAIIWMMLSVLAVSVAGYKAISFADSMHNSAITSAPKEEYFLIETPTYVMMIKGSRGFCTSNMQACEVVSIQSYNSEVYDE